MLLALILTVVVSTAISAICSLMEASLFAVPIAHVRHLANEGSKSGQTILAFKEDMRRPIAAILILNTITHTVGAAVSGALVADLYGDELLIAFSIAFTLIILYFSEIIPKQVGAQYCKTASLFIAKPLSWLILLLYPLVVLTEGISKLVGHSESFPSVSQEEVLSLAEIGREEGVIDHLEGSVIKNIVGLDRLLIKNILTPRVVVFRISKDRKVGELKEEIGNWNHTRVPLFDEQSPDQMTSYVIQRDIFRCLLRDDFEKSVSDLGRPLSTVPELMRADKLLLHMFEQRESICSVVDEHGGFAGIVTLEDVIEEIVGREILDEYDLVGDLRSYAQILYQSRKRRSQKSESLKS